MENRNSLLVDPLTRANANAERGRRTISSPCSREVSGSGHIQTDTCKVLLKLGGRFSSIAHGRMLKWQFPWAKAAWQEG